MIALDSWRRGQDRRNRSNRLHSFEPLEARHMLAANPLISEFMASNGSTLADGEGNFEDWIELQNTGDMSQSFNGWHLTDDPSDLTKWPFPDISLAPGETLVVFASGQATNDFIDSGGNIHTNFRLDANGEYLALVGPGGGAADIVSEYLPGGTEYPEQQTDISFGVGQQSTSTTLIDVGVTADVHVPTGEVANWNQLGFTPDGSWFAATTGVGFDIVGGGGDLLLVDVNDRENNSGALTAAGFNAFVANGTNAIETNDTTRIYGDISVTIQDVSGLGYDDRRRMAPVNSGAFTDQELLQDFIFSRELSGTSGFDVVITGLSANTVYDVSLWSFDDGSAGNRVSDWTANGQTAVDDYAFNGAIDPTTNDQHRIDFNVAADEDGIIVLSGRRETNSLDSGGNPSFGVFLNGLRLSLPGLGAAVTSDIAAQMHNQNSSAYLRLPFDVPAGADYDSLNLDVQYDDGFVAYLNGQEVARRNAPGAEGNPPAFNAAATADRTISEALAVETINLSAFIDQLVVGGAGGDSNVLAIHGLNSSAGDNEFLILPRLTATEVEGLSIGYFSDPTPGELNNLSFSGFVDDTTFSVDRGFYATAFDVEIHTNTPGATIVFTTDGSRPTLTNGAQVAAPDANTPPTAIVNISTTTTLRAAAFKDDFEPTNADTQTYIFLDDVIQQDPLGEQQQINLTPYQISNANTDGTISGVDDWNTGAPNGSSGTQWVPRTTFGTFGTTWQSSSADVPMITTTITGLNAGESYNLFVNYWDADGTNDWNVMAGLSAGALTQFDSSNGFFTGQTEGNRQLYNGYIGTTTANGAGEIEVFIDDVPPNTSLTRTFMDSLGYNQGPPPDTPNVVYPTVWQANATADFAMDPEVVAQWDDDNPANTDFGIREALQSLPTVSIVMNHNDLWGGDGVTGIYPDATIRGLRRQASIEFFDPNTGREFQVDAGVQMHGGASRDNVRLKKHSFRLLFNDDFEGPNELNFPLFPDSPVDEINTVVIRASFTDAFATRTATGRYSPLDSQYTRDVWVRDTQLAMGSLSAHSTYVHLYINGLYWGMYSPAERPDDAFLAEHIGGEREDWDVIKDFNELFRGNRDAWNAMFALADQIPGAADPDAIFYQLQGLNPDGTNDPSTDALLNVDNLIDYMMLHLYAGAEDWPHHNWYAARNRVDPGEGFQFFVWDQEIVLDGRYRDRTDVSNANTPAELYSNLRSSPAFRLRFADRVQLHMFNGGALSVEANQARWMARSNEVEQAIIAESARWGDAREGENVQVDSGGPTVTIPTMTVDHWRAARDTVHDVYFAQAHQLALDRFGADGLLSDLDAPGFQIDSVDMHGGVVQSGEELSFTADGTVVADETILLTQGSPANAFVPVNDSLETGPVGSRWFDEAFTPGGGWVSGTSGVGYEDTVADYNALIGTDIQTQWDANESSLYTRFEFSLDPGFDPNDFVGLTLRMKYDDGFVAYLNGQEVASGFAPVSPTWNSLTEGGRRSEPESLSFQPFDITADIGLLHTGVNVLAIRGLNQATTSTDMLILPELALVETVNVETPDIYYTFDGSDPRAADGSPAGTLFAGPIPLTETVDVKARVFGAGQWSALNQALFTVASPIRVSEIMYNPDGDDSTEFIELVNTSASPVSIAGVRFDGSDQGIEFTLDSGEADLGPGERIVIVLNQAAFAAAYDTAGVRIAAGQYDDNAVALANGGETLTLRDAGGGLIQQFTYDDDWLKETDGDGFSLIAIDTSGDYDDPANWRSSALVGGSPGEADATPVPGDFNGDGATTRADLAHMLSQYGRLTGSHRFRGDFNLDGATTLSDVAGAQGHLGESIVSSPAAPASTVITIAGPRDVDERTNQAANRPRNWEVTELRRTLRRRDADSAATTRAVDEAIATTDVRTLSRAAREYRHRSDDAVEQLFSSDDGVQVQR